MRWMCCEALDGSAVGSPVLSLREISRGRAPFDFVYLDECQVSDIASMLPSFDI